ncbi:MAG: HlyD family efflux transporter periplasmic adaptor subunit [Clostridia bacterium]|nr:HlyD family efflux transporter periplasmic adaptor subunit [Clostridia bacterium]
MKKRAFAGILAALTLMSGAACAEGTLSLDGEIRAGQTKSITAPYGGVVGDYTAQAGDEAQAGTALFAIETQKVYADFDGTVSAVFAEAGDSAAYVQERYGALAYLERETLYTAECTSSGAASDNENKIVHPGERVYIRSSSDSSRKGEAVVTSVSGKGYALEVTREGDLRVNEQIKVYRESDFASDSCIGSGKLSRVDPVAVTAEGHVLAVHVSDGQTVARGDLLFDIVPDALEGRNGGDGSVSMPEDGVLLSIGAVSGESAAKDQVLATYCPAGEMRLVCSVDEDSLSKIETGMKMTVTLDAYPDDALEGEVTGISRVADEHGKFDVTLSLEADERVRVGMNATAEQ